MDTTVELIQRLQQDGLDESSTDDDKIAHLWHLYLKTDVRVLIN